MNANEINKTFEDIARYRAIINEAQAELKPLEDAIKALMQAQGLQELQGDQHKATLKEVSNNRLDTTALKNDLPTVYARYFKEGTTKRFTFA